MFKCLNKIQPKDRNHKVTLYIAKKGSHSQMGEPNQVTSVACKSLSTVVSHKAATETRLKELLVFLKRQAKWKWN
jgi:hypothetical protein